MKTELENTKTETLRPKVRKVDKNLDEYLNKGLFQDKIEKANHVLKTVGLPKEIE